MNDSTQTPAKDRGGWLRYVPPVAALGTAFVLQVIIVTDTLGGALAKTDLRGFGWALGVLFGLSVASCAEGGAAYLMDLYDRHLLARDSVWLLRLAMVVYVAGSAAVIHWWADRHHLPAALSVLLAGMSASALFLWSRGARWRNRQQMVAAGQIDPALPRLPMSAKALHPVRWLRTLYLISWSPVATTDQARGRYEEWRTARGQRKVLSFAKRTGRVAAAEELIAGLHGKAEADLAVMREEAVDLADHLRDAARNELSEARRKVAEMVRSAEMATEQAAVRTCDANTQADTIRTAAYSDADAIVAAARTQADRLIAAATVQVEKVSGGQATGRRTDSAKPAQRTATRQASAQPSTTRVQVSVEQLADTLDLRSPDTIPGRPTAIKILQEAHGSCSGDRARQAIELLSVRRGGQRAADTDQERLQEPQRINGTPLELIGA